MSHTIAGVITFISEVKEFDNGGKLISYRVDTGEDYNNIYQFDMYKKSDYSEHVGNFTKYNKVGDKVEVEFNVSCREYQGKYYTNLQHWKATKIEGSSSVSVPEPNSDDQTDDLPF